MLSRWFFLFLLFCFSGYAKPPELTPRDVQKKIQEILKAHVCYQSLNAELMERVFLNFLEELDPTKTYFLASEISDWTEPSETLIQRGLEGFKKADFSLFQEMHQNFIQAIKRRNGLEKDLLTQELPKGVRNEEFKELSWAKDYEELTSRLLRIKALQIETAEKLSLETRDRFLQRLDKRRLNREAEWVSSQEEEAFKHLLSYIIKAVASSLDAHTSYFTPKEANQFLIQIQQRLFGIGAQLRDDLDGLSVVHILENSPASQSNQIKIHDKIIAVNQEPVVGMEISEAVELIRGEKGTSVVLTILRENQENAGAQWEKFEVELVRNEIVLEEARLETRFEPYANGGIGYLRLFSFYQDTQNCSSSDLRKAIEQMKKEHKLKAILLDLRSNAGGLLGQSVSVAGLFIQKGIVVSTKDNTGRVQHLREIEGNPVWDGPLVILINRATASSAEIVAKSLQDYGRALVLGDSHSFGKGSFQNLTLDPVRHPKTDPQGEYKVTRGRYYTVSGESPQLKGVLSDISIPGTLSELDIGEEFTKYPLSYDTIEPHFEDDLSDLSSLHRLSLGPMYKYNLQPRLTTYLPYLNTLRENSSQRISSNKVYQKFLEEIQKKHFDSLSVDLFEQTDLQLTEALNVAKDLVFLMQFEQK